MSSTILKIISINPSYIPDQLQVESAKLVLSEQYRDQQIEFISTDSIGFIDQGQNFDSVSCNICGQPIVIGDWQDALQLSEEQGHHVH